ncbi:hypothetical protein Hanom_Chr02g00123701 [Helianthus anomalus]
MVHKNIANNFNCKVLAIKQPNSPLTTNTPALSESSSTSMDFSQIDISTLRYNSYLLAFLLIDIKKI